MLKEQDHNSLENKENRSNIIIFAEGLPAFEQEKEFFLIPMEEQVPFFYLKSTVSELGFLLSDPFIFFPNYEIDLPDILLQNLGADSDASSLMVFNILTLGENIKDTTANLLAPIIVNAANRRGMQYVPEKAVYSTKHLLFPRAEDKSALRAQEGP